MFFGNWFGNWFGDYFGADAGGTPAEPGVPVPTPGLSAARAAISRRLSPSKAKLPLVRRIKDLATDQSVREARSTLDAVTSTRIPFGAPVTVEFTAAATPTRVVHGLSTAPTGYIVVRKSAALDVYDSTTSAGDSSYLVLESTAAGTVTLWVF